MKTALTDRALYHVEHKVHGESHWYVIRVLRDLQHAKLEAQRIAIDNGGETRVVKVEEAVR